MTAVLRDRRGYPIGLLRINVDISMFEAIHALANDFLRFGDDRTRLSSLFQSDWREEVNCAVGQFLSDRGTSLAAMNIIEREALVDLLESRGLFDIRNAAPYIAKIPRLSRAALYEALKAVRERKAAAS